MSQTIADTLMQRLNRELIEDLAVIYGLGVKDPQEPEAEKAREIANQITAPWQLYWLASHSNIGLHTESPITTSWDMTAATLAAFYSRVRAPLWVPHPECAANTIKAKTSVHGRVLMTSAQTMMHVLVASGYVSNFEGPPTLVANHIRAWLKGTS